jgi:hypothetical protein
MGVGHGAGRKAPLFRARRSIRLAFRAGVSRPPGPFPIEGGTTGVVLPAPPAADQSGSGVPGLGRLGALRTQRTRGGLFWACPISVSKNLLENAFCQFNKIKRL